jgi:hypothetical protein
MMEIKQVIQEKCSIPLDSEFFLEPDEVIVIQRHDGTYGKLVGVRSFYVAKRETK